jgi:shikimate kinase
MNVVLFGYRGSGKTTLGMALAAKLGMAFADADQEVVRRFGGRTIAEVWERYGEAKFRAVELEVAVELVGRRNLVLALGGGTVMQPAARTAVENAVDTVRIYLYCQPRELHRRIVGDPGSAAARPSLTPWGGGIDEVTAVLAQRDPVYRAVAQHILDVTNLSPAQALAALAALV